MALGSYDANDIWNFGESDNIAPFSTTLNKLASSTSSAITADRARLATLEAGSLSGLIPVKPTSVAGAATSITTSTLGTVTFSGATSVSLNGVFSTLYKNYLVIYNSTGGSVAGSELRLRFRTAGVDNTTAGFIYGGNYGTSAGATGSRAGSGLTYSVITYNNNTTSYAGRVTLNINSPQLPQNTWFSYQGGYWDGTSIVGDVVSGFFSQAVSHDGFTVYASAGTVNGTITVYGYNN